MEFTLFYRGQLKAKGRLNEKQDLRRYFHVQLKELWNQLPLKAQRDEFLQENPPKGRISLIFPVKGFKFAPLVSERIKLVAEVNVVFLRPEPPGAIVTQGGDIDNRLKTLLDSLRMPKGPNELPPSDSPRNGETPFFCLLEDDSLVTRISVNTDRLLEPCRDPTEAVLLIHVVTKATVSVIANLGLG